MKTVFIVLREVKYESDDIMCVFADEQEAEQYAQEQNDLAYKNHKHHQWHYVVVEYAVN